MAVPRGPFWQLPLRADLPPATVSASRRTSPARKSRILQTQSMPSFHSFCTSLGQMDSAEGFHGPESIFGSSVQSRCQSVSKHYWGVIESLRNYFHFVDVCRAHAGNSGSRNEIHIRFQLIQCRCHKRRSVTATPFASDNNGLTDDRIQLFSSQ